MAHSLHRVRFQWANAAIELECAKGRGERRLDPISAPFLDYVEAQLEPDAFDRRGVPAMCWRGDAPVLFQSFQLRENTEYFIDVTLPLTKAEAETRAQMNHAWPFVERLSRIFRRDPVRRWRETDTGGVIVSGRLALRNHAGIVDLRTDYGTELLAEVVCRKIDYLEEFRTLLDQVAEELAELLLQYDSPVSASFSLTDVTSQNEAALLFQLRHIMAERNLPVAIDELTQRFHSVLVQRQTQRHISEIEQPDIESFVEEMDVSTLTEGGPLAGLFRGYSPQSFPVEDAFETVDTAENRYVKYFLEEIYLLAQRLASRLASKNKRASAHEARGWVTELDEILGHGLWREVGPFRQFPSNSQVLQKRRGYREILTFDLSLRMSLSLPWQQGEVLAEGLLGDIRPVSELYEYWCFFLLRRTIKGICEQELPNDGSLISVTDGSLQVHLLKGKRSRASFLYKKTAMASVFVNLFYNRRFKKPSRALSSWDGSYTAQFDPDYSVEVIVKAGDTQQRHWLHFDAKYRLEVADIEAAFKGFGEALDDPEQEEDTEYDRELARIHKRDDLFKMHTYRDGILSSRGAYILFPGDGAEIRITGNRQNLFTRHPTAFAASRPEYLFPSVGAFDLCPGRDEEQRAVLKQFLTGVLDVLTSAAPYTEEHGLFSPTP